MRSRAIYFTGVDAVAVGETEVPEPEPGEALVAASFTAISPGTELRCLAGKQGGAPPWPFIPGYSLSGRVARVGAGVDLAEGTPVFCTGTARCEAARLWGGHLEFAVQPAGRVWPLPEGVDLLEASLAHLIAIAYHGVRLSRPQPHETVAVVGLGPIGQLSARLHAAAGARVVAFDLSPERIAPARRAGLIADTPDRAGELLPEGASIVVDATGTPATLPRSASLLQDKPWDDCPAPGARLLIQGSYPGDFALPYATVFQKEATLLVPRDMQPRDIRAALDLLARGRLDVSGLIGRVALPEEAATVYAALQASRSELLTAAFQW